MLTEKQIMEIREHLETSQNPLFFFDNDTDGLCSFLLLRRHAGRGNGVVIKSYPDLNESYARKIREFDPDRIFILDKPYVSGGFLEYARQRNIPVIWIDHHQMQSQEYAIYYNPLEGDPDDYEPVSSICHKVTKKDEWIAMMGCLGDYYLPDFTERFAREFPDLLSRHRNPGEAKYETEIGRLIRLVDFALKDKTGNVTKMLKALADAKSPYDILNREKPYESVWKRHDQIKKKYDWLLEKAKSLKHEKSIFFRYSGDLSISRELSDELAYNFPEKLVIVVYVKGEKANVSLRGGGKKDMAAVLAKALEGIEGSGGGHKRACGAVIRLKDMEAFKEAVEAQFR